MPSRPVQHVTADQAVAAVRSTWATQGAAVEEIHRDYGEDLLVQAQLNGRMDGSRIWVQVKGTRSDLSNDSPTLPPVKISSSLALRWSRTSDLVVVILWDVQNQVGWFARPQSELVQADLLDNLHGHVNLKLTRNDKFNLAAAEHLVWNARIKLANVQLQGARQGASDSEGLSTEEHYHYRMQAAAILVGIMRDLKIVCEDADNSLEVDFVRLIRNRLGDSSKDIDSASSKELSMRAVILAVVDIFAKNAANNPAPTSLLIAIAELVHRALFEARKESAE